MKYGIVIVVFSVLFQFPTLQEPSAGTLDDFEQDVSKGRDRDRERKGKDRRYSGHHGRKMAGNLLAEIFIKPFLIFFEEGAKASLQRAGGGGKSLDFGSLVPRQPGEPLIPFFRSDFSYQNVESDVAGLNSRVELGFGPVGFQTRIDYFDEIFPNDTLLMMQFHGLFRSSLGNYIELDLGIGGFLLTGKEENSGVSLTLPFLIHPWRYFGFELRPAWGFINGGIVRDYDAGVAAGKGFMRVRGGYRWVRSENESLNGPYVGLSFIY